MVHLTPTEFQVLEQVALGKINKQIAHALDKSEASVKIHIKSLFKKLRCNNRTELALCAIRDFGLGDVHPLKPDRYHLDRKLKHLIALHKEALTVAREIDEMVRALGELPRSRTDLDNA